MTGNQVRTVYLVILCVLCIRAQHRFGCDEDFCTKKVAPCPELNCKENSRIIKNATTCGCCDICIEALGEGERCKTREFASIPRQECGPGLQCDKIKAVCVPANTECIKDQKKFDAESIAGEMLIGRKRPECDSFGRYKPVVCVSDVLCYCVDKDGKRIFGTDLDSKRDDMHCNCSRDFKKFPKDVPVGDFLRCLPNGNYDALQCTDEWCYCMNKHFQVVGVEVKANTTIKNLLCYDEERHRHDDALLRSKCVRERNDLLEQMKTFEDEGTTVIGVDLPQCDLDGSYAPVQCKKDSCYCVKKNGSPFEGFQVSRYSEEAKQMNCRCLREKDMLYNEKRKNREMQFFEKYQCASNGNYKSKQCVETKSFLVDDMGFQISNEVIQQPMDCD